MKRKVIFIVPDIFSNGGLTRVTIQVMNELLKIQKYDISVISLSESNDEIPYKLDSGIEVKCLPIKNFNIRKDSLKAARLLKKVIPKDFEGTVVVDDVGHTIPVYLGIKRCKKIKKICWSHTNYYNGKSYGFSGFGRRLATKKFDKLIVLTKEDKEYYSKINKRNNIVQIYNPIVEKVKQPDYDENVKKIISCGRLHMTKGFDLLIDVAKLVFEKIDGWTWDIYGDGPEYDNLLGKIEQLNLKSKVNLMGYNKDVVNLYEKYSFNVFTSFTEGCPLAMIEAMSSGLPVVSFNFHCGPKDLITEGKNGYIIENRSIEDMANKIIYLIQNDNIRKKMAANSCCNLAELELSYVLKQWEEIL